jgi:hypothetical protein
METDLFIAPTSKIIIIIIIIILLRLLSQAYSSW